MFNDGKKQQARADSLRNHGLTSSQKAGVKRFAPLSSNGGLMPEGSYYDSEQGSVRIYDGNVKVIDGEYFNGQVQKHIAYEEQLETFAEKLIKSGDQLASYYLEEHFLLLKEGGMKDIHDRMVNWLVLDGIAREVATKAVDDVDKVDGTPSSIRYSNDSSDNYTMKIRKIIMVLRFSGIVFTNVQTATPEDAIDPYTRKALGAGIKKDLEISEDAQLDMLARTVGTGLSVGQSKTAEKAKIAFGIKGV